MLKKLAGQSIIYVTSDFIVKSTNLILTPYFIYKLSVPEFGQFGIIVAVIALGQVFFNLGFQSGLIRYFYLDEKNRAGNISSSYFFLTLVSFVTIPLLSYLIYSLNLFEKAYVGFVNILELVLASALYGVFINNGIALLKVQEKPIASGILGFTTSFFSLISIIIFIEFELFNHLSSIIIGQLIGISIGAITTVILLKEYLTINISIDYFRVIFKYAFPLTMHNLFQWSLNNVDRFIIVKILGSYSLGGYFFAYQFANGTKIILRSINSSLLSIYSQLSVSKVDLDKVKRINKVYIIIVCLLFLFVSIIVPIFIQWMNFQKYNQYLYLIPLLTGGGCLYGLYYLPMNIISITLGKSKHLYLITLFATIISMSLNFMLVNNGEHVAAYVYLSTYFIMLLGFILVANRHELYKSIVWSNHMNIAILTIVVLSVIMAFLI